MYKEDFVFESDFNICFCAFFVVAAAAFLTADMASKCAVITSALGGSGVAFPTDYCAS